VHFVKLNILVEQGWFTLFKTNVDIIIVVSICDLGECRMQGNLRYIQEGFYGRNKEVVRQLTKRGSASSDFLSMVLLQVVSFIFF
jgi:hypothetical protein